MATIQKWGNSLGVRIPKSLSEQTSLREGSEVEIVAAGRTLTIRPKRCRRRYTLDELLAQATSRRSPHRKLDRSEPVGRELL